MSDLWTSPSGDEEAVARRRAVFGLLSLAVIALLVVGVMVLVFGRSNGGHSNNGRAGAAPTLSGEASSTSAGGSSSTKRSSSPPTHPTTPTSTAVSCPSPAPCAIPGDAGAIAALNAFRISHTAPAVPGSVSLAAQQCALSQGNGPTCEPSYAWEPVPTHDGAAAINLVAGRNPSWLLDQGMTSFSVGWAFVPGGPGSPGQYWCAIVKVG